MASSMVSGNGSFFVSGIKKHNINAKVANIPMTSNGNGLQIRAKDSINKPKNAPIAEAMAPIPIVVLLIGVG